MTPNPTPFPDPTVSELIKDRIDLEQAMTKLFVAFRDKYPRATHEIECRATYGCHMAPVVRIRSTF